MNCLNRYIVFDLVLCPVILFLSVSFACGASESSSAEQQCEMGVVYSVSKSKIVIDDRLFELAGATQSKNGYVKGIGITGLKAGDQVEYCIAIKNGQLTQVTRIGKSEQKQSVRHRERIVKPVHPSNTIHLENGVWKN